MKDKILKNLLKVLGIYFIVAFLFMLADISVLIEAPAGVLFSIIVSLLFEVTAPFP